MSDAMRRPEPLSARPVTPALALGALLLVTASCGHGRLVPGTNAHLAAGEPMAAMGADNGVRVVANCDDWRGLQKQLPDDITPIKIRIVNGSAHHVLILYEGFSIEGRHGRRYRALPVVPLRHAGFAAIHPVYAAANFEVAPRYHDVYPTLAPWQAQLDRDEAAYDTAYRHWRDTPPTRTIQRQALPEGVLGPGGAVTGYLYFESPLDTESRLNLEARLDSGRTGTSIARISIPLEIQ